MITMCPEDSVPLTGIGEGHDLTVGSAGLSVLFDREHGVFSIRRGTREIYRFKVDDLDTNAEVLWSPNGQEFVLNYSDSGALGGFHVRVYQIDIASDDKVTDASRAVQGAIRDFKKRHYCKARGNNVSVLKWTADSKGLLVMTSVYPTGDCGPDEGHAEGYVVSVPDGNIKRHLTLTQLQNYPGVCLQNDEP